MGYADEARKIQDLYLDRKIREAAAAVPQDFIERTAMVGPRARIVSRLREYAAAGVGTLSISPYVGDLESGLTTLRTVAEAFEESGVAS
jgi:alkanesulfonate monooxygenase SsuD/methylene tetrahydromethanopterin reductase-like flavin-dependent oxidoreductase (luciferase family)